MKSLIAGAAVLAVCVVAPLQASAAPAPTVCAQDTQAFSGAAASLVVPAGGYCAISNATITGDLVLQDGAGADLSHVTIGGNMTGGVDAGAGIFDTSIVGSLSLRGGDGGADLGGVRVGGDYFLSDGAGTHMERTSIGHDFVATEPSTVQTGKIAPDSPGGAVTVGHDVLISGSPADNPFVFDGICALNVAHDMRVTGRTVTFGFGIASGGCRSGGQPGNTIGHDLVVTGNVAGNGSSLRIADDRVGHDLVFGTNTALDGGSLIVTNNVVGHDLLCAANSPTVTVVAPNTAGHVNTCG